MRIFRHGAGSFFRKTVPCAPAEAVPSAAQVLELPQSYFHSALKLPTGSGFVGMWPGSRGRPPKSGVVMSVLTVLLVDDIELFLAFERRLFEPTGCRILTAASGLEALEVARSERPHVILLDWEMPGMKGDEVCRILKEDSRTRHIPILVVTAFGHDEIKDRCLGAGATGFLTKPVAGKELLRRVVELLEIPPRVFLRSTLSIEISLLEGEVKRKAEGFSEDVSETGMLLEVSEYIPRGSELAVKLSVPGHQERLRLLGDVARTFERKARGRFGVGVKFGSLEPGVRHVLRRYVEEATR